MRAIRGVVQHYAWGHHTFIPRLLGLDADGRPWAEWWLGTHPNGPSTLDDGRLLSDVAGELPYLLKVLAVAEPLSLQAHPSAALARDGFRRGVYPDPNPKPELLCALTPFEALCGIRPIDRTLEILDSLGPAAADLAACLGDDGPAAAIAGLLRRSLPAEPIVDACRAGGSAAADLVRGLAERYPGDPSVVVTLLLNHVVLQPGEAIHLAAGNLHAYLHGCGVELMGGSDNVVRGGLTVKPVDVDELLRVLDPTPLAEPVMRPSDRYELPEVGVALVRLEDGQAHRASVQEVALDLDGGAWSLDPGDELTASATTFVVTS